MDSKDCLHGLAPYAWTYWDRRHRSSANAAWWDGSVSRMANNTFDLGWYDFAVTHCVTWW